MGKRSLIGVEMTQLSNCIPKKASPPNVTSSNSEHRQLAPSSSTCAWDGITSRSQQKVRIYGSVPTPCFISEPLVGEGWGYLLSTSGDPLTHGYHLPTHSLPARSIFPDSLPKFRKVIFFSSLKHPIFNTDNILFMP